MDFISNQEPQIKEMLRVIGISDVEELFRDIPSSLRLPRPTKDDGLSEYEGRKLMEGLAAKNRYSDYEHYLGGGAYEHYVPALVGAICGKSEFLTSYTPYQAEASQGMLQIIFEYQSVICALTGMDVSNASLYDGASACAEAVLMALRLNKERKKVIMLSSLHPNYREVVWQYVCSYDIDLHVVHNMEELSENLNEETAGILIQSPNFFGEIEVKAKEAFAKAREKGVLSILCSNPLSYGLYTDAGELGADIAVGDCQPFGIPLQFGGPYAGYIACRQEHVRQMPGRIVGETLDKAGKRGFVLTLQAREQHIRREKATSNICTNQALTALAALIGILWYGKEGVKKLALTNYQRTAYLRQKLGEIEGISVLTGEPFFNEFAVSFGKPLSLVIDHFRSHGIEPGLNLGRWYKDCEGQLLVCVTELKSKESLDRYIQVASSLYK